ncbi:MAG: biotin carboxylase N-terminal domain-containing protein [Hyphomicrobiaceae bacterium]|nr:biotin carboxylase N-terminal domain-containing protein [Hyphomicrobiaceae bacterium]
MLKRVLIANRGEIALRIMRTARRLGIATVAVASEADRHAPFARAADEVVEIGPGPATESYLRIDRIIAAAKATGADCIHPGYGFLAENAEFAEAVAGAGLKFVGPSPEAMRALGGKAAAKEIAIKARVPVVPGYQGAEQAAAALASEASRIGYPVMIKAVAGGGGRGMRLVETAADFATALESAQREAQASFGDARILIEKLVVAPRHIEVQVFGDSHGNVVHLFERDCSLQRRNQKVIEEAPAPGMGAGLRKKITDAAVAVAAAVGYEGAGTVEFLVEGGKLTDDAPWYFIEMNTRLQVEHPVTELVTGLDLVEWQFRVASGEALPLKQAAIRLAGHAIEGRLCAENPAKGFLPATGPVVAFAPPAMEGLRVDAGIEAGSIISPFYDSMIAKLIAFGPDRETAAGRLAAALETTVVAGPKTNASFLHALVVHPAFRAGTMDTGLIGRELPKLAPAIADNRAVALGALALMRATQAAVRVEPHAPASPWDAGDAFQLGGWRRQTVSVLADVKPVKVSIEWRGDGAHASYGGESFAEKDRDGITVVEGDDAVFVLAGMRQTRIAWPAFDIGAEDEAGDGTSVRAPIVGRVAKIFVKAGDPVAKGDRVAVVEAMKMEHVLHAGKAGRIARLGASEGQQVTQGAVIATIAD